MTTAKDIERLLAKRYAAPEYAFLTQVRNGTGFQRAVRTADALAMSLYPSRGLTLAGFEIKVSKSDLKRELEQPDKAEEIARFCHTWWIVAPDGIADPDELPATWGLQVVKNSKLVSMKPATMMDPEPPSVLMLAAIMRKVAETTVPASIVEERVQERVEAHRKLWESQRDMELIGLRKRDEITRKFEADSGIRMSRWDIGNVASAVRTIVNGEYASDRYRKELEHVQQAVSRLQRGVDEALAELADAEVQP